MFKTRRHLDIFWQLLTAAIIGKWFHREAAKNNSKQGCAKGEEFSI